MRHNLDYHLPSLRSTSHSGARRRNLLRATAAKETTPYMVWLTLASLVIMLLTILYYLFQ